MKAGKKIWMLCMALVLSMSAIAGEGLIRDGSLSVRYADTVAAKMADPMAGIRLAMSNNGRDSQAVFLNLNTSGGWRSMSARQVLQLAPGAHRNVIFNLLRDRSATGRKWAELNVQLSTKPGDTQRFQIYLCTQTNYKCVMELLGESEVYFDGSEHKKTFSLRIRNEGNVPGSYKLQWTLDRFGIRKIQTIALDPGMDTTLRFRLSLDKKQLKELSRETFTATLQDDSGRKHLVLWDLWRSASQVKQHVSSYKSFPVRVEIGGLSRANSSYIYGAVDGSIPLGRERGLQFSYRTQQYTEQNYNQEDIFRISYLSPKWKFYAGQAQHYSNFPIYGNELSVGLKGKRASAEVWYQKPYSNQIFSTEQAGASLAYRIGNISLSHTVDAALDSSRHPGATILDTKIGLIKTPKTLLTASIGAAAGSVRGIVASTGIAANKFAGMSYGSDFQYTGKKFSAYSSLLWTSPDYPGIMRGARRIAASISQSLGKHFSLAPFYNLNEISYNYSIDTLLNTNRIDYNREKYGLEGRFKTRQFGFTAALGNYRDTRSMEMPKYQYAELRLDFHNKKDLQIGLNSQSGISPASEERGTPQLWFNSTTANFNTRHFSLSGNYYRYPFFWDQDGKPLEASYLETMNAMATLQFRMFSCLDVNLFYQLSRYTMNDFITHDLGGNLSFRSFDNSLIINLTGSMPLHASAADNAAAMYSRNYVQLSVSKAIHMPVLSRKRYFDLGMELFYDENGNGIRDKGEPPIEDSRVAINDRRFNSSSKGKVQYLNLDKGEYRVDLSGLKAAEGFLPPGSHAEIITLAHDTTLRVPFRKAALITGRVTFRMDEFSEIRPVIAGIKVTVADSSGRVIGSTLTNADGVFKMSVPAGYYIVSLNPEAFNNEMKPERMSLVADLRAAAKEDVEFTVKQRKREIRILQAPGKG